MIVWRNLPTHPPWFGVLSLSSSHCRAPEPVKGNLTMFLELHGKAVLSLTQPFSMIGDPPSWKRVRMHAAAITEQDIWDNPSQLTNSYFSEGLKPPTSATNCTFSVIDAQWNFFRIIQMRNLMQIHPSK